MTASIAPSALAAFLLCAAAASAAPDRSGCEPAARTRAGLVCGARRCASSGVEYASFRGVPYAKQPLGELRFQELQPLEPWIDAFNATAEGPVCPQTDVVYRGLQPHAGGESEACIHANIHVPLDALPEPSGPALGNSSARGLPIFVFIHGGGFAAGSGDTDLHGPEYLLSKGVIVITFNYRLNVFGFLSLNSESVPGNNGLRDCVTLLRWVRDNARAFGGNPDEVTLAGQSAGASMAHLLTMSPVAKGLFKRAVLFSGTATSEFFSTSPEYAKTVAGLFLAKLGILPTLPAAEVHRRLVRAPLRDLLRAHAALLDVFGLSVFAPVQRQDPPTPPTVEPGAHVPLIVGFTSAECETFRPRFADIAIDEKIAATPALLVPLRLAYSAPPAALPVLAKLIEGRYFNSTRTLDDFVAYCSRAYYEYPALKLAERRAEAGAAPTYVFRFAYGGRRSAVKEALRLDFEGAGHIEDITYVFRANSVLGPLAATSSYERDEDDEMTDVMTGYMINFMQHSYPEREGWSAVRLPVPQLLDIAAPDALKQRAFSDAEKDTLSFFDDLYRIARGD